MARDEEKSEYRRVAAGVLKRGAQSTLEYALLLPLLFMLILGIMELALMWHANNALQFASQAVVENVAISDCSLASISEIVANETAILQGRKLSFTASRSGVIYTFNSNSTFEGYPLVRAKVACASGFDGVVHGAYSTVQLQSVYVLHFFGAKLPNLKTGQPIVLIPNNVTFTSTKSSAMRRF